MSVYETAFSAILSSPSTLFWSTLLHNTVYGSRQVYLTTCFVFGHRPQCYHLTYSIEFQKKEEKKERKKARKKERKKESIGGLGGATRGALPPPPLFLQRYFTLKKYLSANYKTLNSGPRCQKNT